MRMEGYGRRIGKRVDEAVDPGGDAEREADEAKARADGEPESGAAQEDLGEPEPTASPLDPERASLLEQALREAWTIARCDQRLTQRLGLL